LKSLELYLNSSLAIRLATSDEYLKFHFYEKHRYTEVSTDISTDGERTIEMEKKI
jgi:hypothetical protein